MSGRRRRSTAPRSSMKVLDETRDWPRTSDHVPVIADFVIE